MRYLTLALVLMVTITVDLYAVTKVPSVAVHIEKHGRWTCAGLPSIDKSNIRTTYEGMGEIDAFFVLFDFDQIKGVSFGIDWPKTWGEGTWHDCAFLRAADIAMPGDHTGIVWKECITDSTPVIIGWLTLTVTSPGTISVTPSPMEGAVTIGDCTDTRAKMSEVVIQLKAGAGGAKGDDLKVLQAVKNRNWHVRPGSEDMASINDAIRGALPGDTVFVAEGRYNEAVLLRPGVVTLGSWDADFKRRSVNDTPSIIDGTGIRSSLVRGTFAEDTTTVLDGFVITGGTQTNGAGMALRNGSSPMLRNLIISSNKGKFGGAMYCHASSPVIRNVLMAANEAQAGAGIYCVDGSSPLISGSTLVANKAPYGGAIAAVKSSSPYMENTIVADHEEGGAIYTMDETARVTLKCCDLWHNQPSDFGGVADENSILRDTISEDPQFTDPSKLDFRLKASSPALSSQACPEMGSRAARVPQM
jgi:hypothetical protein